MSACSDPNCPSCNNKIYISPDDFDFETYFTDLVITPWEPPKTVLDLLPLYMKIDPNAKPLYLIPNEVTEHVMATPTIQRVKKEPMKFNISYDLSFAELEGIAAMPSVGQIIDKAMLDYHMEMAKPPGTQVYFDELGSQVMMYWGWLIGNTFGTITDVYLLDDGSVRIYTNYVTDDGKTIDYDWSLIKKETVDNIIRKIKVK